MISQLKNLVCLGAILGWGLAATLAQTNGPLTNTINVSNSAAAGTNILVATNTASTNDGSSSLTNAVASAPGTNSLDKSSFEVIARRNIFNPDRSPRRSSGPTVRPKRTESFTLVGTFSYEKGDFAVFDGTSSRYRKTAKLSDRIAGYQITAIFPDHVTLGATSNKSLTLPVGAQMRRREGESWTYNSVAEAMPDTASDSSSSTNSVTSASPTQATPASDASAASGDQSDIIKRLMARRAAEK